MTTLAQSVPFSAFGSRSATHPLLRCLAIYRQMPVRFAVTVMLFVIVNASYAWQQWLVGRAIDEVARGTAVARLADGRLDYSVAWQWFGILVAVATVRGVLQYGAGVLSLIIGQELLFVIRERILLQVQSLDIAYHWRHGVGEILTRTTRDADKLRDALISVWRQVFETALIVAASVGLLCWYDWSFGLVPLLLVSIALFIFVRQTDQLVTLDRAVGAAYDRVNQDLTEGVSGVRVIKAFALESRRVDAFTRHVGTFKTQAREALAFAASRIPLPQFVVSLGHVWILAHGASLVSTGRLNLGELITALLVATTLVFRIEGIGRVMQVFADARSSAARIWELLDARPQIESGRFPMPPGPLGFSLINARVMAPGGGIDVLNGCSLAVAPGEVVALVGTTGSGKSTLAALLPRLLEVDGGAVAVGSNQTDWHDVRSLNLAELRRRVHVVPQETFLFSDTVAANLRLSAPEAGDAELHEALRLAAADDVVAALKDGLQTRIGDRGITLSGGQRQRLCLARALLARPDILVLDDATSALDAVTERAVLANIRRLSLVNGRPITLLVISSKLSTIMLADRVVMLGNGRIVAQGRHEDLAREDAVYRELLGIDNG